MTSRARCKKNLGGICRPTDWMDGSTLAWLAARESHDDGGSRPGGGGVEIAARRAGNVIFRKSTENKNKFLKPGLRVDMCRRRWWGGTLVVVMVVRSPNLYT